MSELEVVLDLGEMPLANGLLRAEDLSRPEPRYPLALGFCSECCLAQITETVPPRSSFATTPISRRCPLRWSSTPASSSRRIVATRGLDATSLVIEPASNDGYLLQHYVPGNPGPRDRPGQEHRGGRDGARDPDARRVLRSRDRRGARAAGRQADVIHANNVLAHVPDLDGFVAAMATVLKPSGVIVIETPYVRDLVDRLEFDTIYHEHVFYYSLSSLVASVRSARARDLDVSQDPHSRRVVARVRRARSNRARLGGRRDAARGGSVDRPVLGCLLQRVRRVASSRSARSCERRSPA